MKSILYPLAGGVLLAAAVYLAFWWTGPHPQGPEAAMTDYAGR